MQSTQPHIPVNAQRTVPVNLRQTGTSDSSRMDTVDTVTSTKLNLILV